MSDAAPESSCNMAPQVDENGTSPADEENEGLLLNQNGSHQVETSSDENDEDDDRLGTTASARFNVLSTMVGGGSLSLPLAFQKSGNALLGPIILIVVSAITEFCFRVHVGSARISTPVSDTERRRGKDSFESVTQLAFGQRANIFSMVLVTAMCFFGTVGYAVLLRDMLQPITDWAWQNQDGYEPANGPTFYNNLTMLMVVFLVTPLCVLKTLTALKRFGAASMCSVLILGTVVLYRSVQCNVGMTEQHEWTSFKLFPDSWKDLLDVFPLYVSCFVCHYNLLPVHNELQRPTATRVGWWLRSTTWVSCAFYLTIGISGSAYGKCTDDGDVSGNILLDFPEDDPLLFLGRMCLALTITLAFPMLTIPGRDIIIRCLPDRFFRQHRGVEENPAAMLREPLLENQRDADVEQEGDTVAVTESSGDEATVQRDASLLLRLLLAMLVFWTAVAVACCVESIDIVWDLLGSSLSILLSYLIPCGSYLAIVSKVGENGGPHDLSARMPTKWLSWLLIVVFIPLMIVSTANAVMDTFFTTK